MAKIYVYPKKGDPFSCPLESSQISLGRSSENDLPLADPFCSKVHAYIIPHEDGGYAVVDNQSKNGVFLNSQRVVEQRTLKVGDEILLGSTRIVFDLKRDTNVEVTDAPSPSANINSVLNVKDVLKRPDLTTTVRADSREADIENLRSQAEVAQVINDVSKALLLHKPEDELLDDIMALISQNLRIDRGFLMLYRESEKNPQLELRSVQINDKNHMNQKIKISQTIINKVVEEHSSVLISDAQSDTHFGAQKSIVDLQINSAMCVPLWNNRKIIGIIYADRISLPTAFKEDDLRLLTLMGNLAAVKIENTRNAQKAKEKENMERELALASEIQRGLLPKRDPEIPGYDIAGANVPCFQVGGDYFDFIRIDAKRLGIAIADVSGKGVSASLHMASLRAHLQSEIRIFDRLDEMAKRLNEDVHHDTSINQFVTFFYGELNLENGEFRYINAGHNPPLILSKKTIRHLKGSGFALGMFSGVTYDEHAETLQPGEILLLYTDGITETRNPDNVDFEESGLTKTVRKHAGQPARSILNAVFDGLDKFAHGTPPMDDRTLMIVIRVP